jgi:acetyl esterase/lipase
MASRVNARCAVLYSPTYFDYGQMQKALAEEKDPAILERMKLIRSIVDDHLTGNPAAWEAFKRASALTEAPQVRFPVLIIDGGNDISLPHWMVNEYVAKLRAAGKKVETYLPANGPHGFYYGDSPEAREAQKRTLVFFKKYLAPGP